MIYSPLLLHAYRSVTRYRWVPAMVKFDQRSVVAAVWLDLPCGKRRFDQAPTQAEIGLRQSPRAVVLTNAELMLDIA